MRLGVEVQGKEAGKVQRETANRSDAVVKFLRSRQVEKLETTGISLQPNYDFSNNQRRLIGYIGANLISFQIDIAQAGILIDEAVKVGATRIDGVSFTAGESAIAAAQRTALIKATEQAREQATIVLQALGLVAKETVSIQVGNTGNPVPIARSEAVFRSRSADAASSPVIGGEQTLRAAVTLEISY